MNKDLLRFDENKKLVFFDAETLNLCLSFCHNLPWQIALLKVQNGKETEAREFYIKWETHLKISKDSARITKYDQSVVDKKGVPPLEAFDLMYSWFEEADLIVGHNILGFDIYLIKEFCELSKKPWRHFLPKFLDTNYLGKAMKLNLSLNGDNLFAFQMKLLHSKNRGVKTSLTHLGKEFSIDHDYESLHNALSDLRLNLKVYNKLKYAIDF